MESDPSARARAPEVSRAEQSDADDKSARLFRMVMPGHVCPYGLKALDLLKRQGFSVDDRHLQSREQTDDFKRKHAVETTPQVFIEDRRIGGYDALRAHFGQPVKGPEETTLRPVLVLLAVAVLIALAIAWPSSRPLLSLATLESAVALAMVLLGLQKLKDVERFSTMFLNYDLLAQRYVPYAYGYAYAETAAGLLMLAGAWPWLAAPIALFIGSVGAVSVIKAVYVDRRELKCACVGGDSQVPLGAVSLAENLAMVAMGSVLLVRWL